MSRSFILPFLFLLFITACNESTTTPTTVEEQSKEGEKEDNFFPVTEYILGQIAGIRSDGINPIKRTGKDSTWVKVEDLEKEMSEFLTPIIDSINMKTFYRESKFLDQTIDAYTFTYEPKKNLPDSLDLRGWTVYVDPKNYTVRRIYMVKERGDSTLQLTWQSGKWCKIAMLNMSESGVLSLSKETEFIWKY